MFLIGHLVRAFRFVAVLTGFLVSIDTAFSHGFAGARFFPATLSTDDPFVNDELSLPTVSSIVTPEEGGTRETEISVVLPNASRRILASKLAKASSISGHVMNARQMALGIWSSAQSTNFLKMTNTRPSSR